MYVKKIELVLSLNGLQQAYSSTCAVGMTFALSTCEWLRLATKTEQVGGDNALHPEKSCTFEYDTDTAGKITGYITISKARYGGYNTEYLINQPSLFLTKQEHNGNITGTYSVSGGHTAGDDTETITIIFDQDVDLDFISYIPAINQFDGFERDGSPLSFIRCYNSSDTKVFSNKDKPTIFDSFQDLWSKLYQQTLTDNRKDTWYNHFKPIIVKLSNPQSGLLTNTIKSNFLFLDEQTNQVKEVVGLNNEQIAILEKLLKGESVMPNLRKVIFSEHKVPEQEMQFDVLYITPAKNFKTV